MSLIRCDYCGMSYDGGRHGNCPHCNAPRPACAAPDEEPMSIDSRIDALDRMADASCTVFYSDDMPYYIYMPSNGRCGIESDVAEDATPLNEPDGLMSDVHEDARTSDNDIPMGVSIPIALLFYFAFVLLMCMISKG